MDDGELPPELLRYLADSTLELLGYDGSSETLSMKLTKEIGPETGLLRFHQVSHINLPPRLSLAGIERVPLERLRAKWSGLGGLSDEQTGFLLHESWGEECFVVASTLDYTPDPPHDSHR
jgi:hypothetical protein